MLSSALLVTCLAVFTYGKFAARSTVVHETREHAPEAFRQKGSAPPDTVLNLRNALVQNDIQGLQKALLDVSTPGNALYGQHLSKEEVQYQYPHLQQLRGR